jgi:hypothetical protein
VVTTYPHDRLSQIAAVMADAFDRQPGTDDVRVVILVNDAEGGCIHLRHYDEPVEGAMNESLVFLDMAAHLMETGKALGVHVQVLVERQAVEPRGGKYPSLLTQVKTSGSLVP